MFLSTLFPSHILSRFFSGSPFFPPISFVFPNLKCTSSKGSSCFIQVSRQRIDFKILVLVFKSIHHQTPQYISRTVQCQTATPQFIVFTSFCWTSHPVLNLSWQILFLLWSETLKSITETYQMCWINRHLQETPETLSFWFCVLPIIVFHPSTQVFLLYFCAFLWSTCTNFVFDQGTI